MSRHVDFARGAPGRICCSQPVAAVLGPVRELRYVRHELARDFVKARVGFAYSRERRQAEKSVYCRRVLRRVRLFFMRQRGQHLRVDQSFVSRRLLLHIDAIVRIILRLARRHTWRDY